MYDWEAHKKEQFAWWVRRFHHLLEMYDLVRIDHFRGLISYWEVPATEHNALKGTWQPAAVHDLMGELLRHFPTLPVIAEDLGNITAEVREAMAIYGIPGIKVLLLAFETGARESVYLPHSYARNCVVYTGTHDVNTVMGWFNSDEHPDDRDRFFEYVGRRIDNEVNWEMVRLALMSVAETSIIPMQDLLGAGAEARMNTPGKEEGNWQWRLSAIPPPQLGRRLAEMTETYGRS